MNLASCQEWENDIKTYLSATKLFNFFLDDPLLDYLDKFAPDLGLEPSDIPEEIKYIMQKGVEFEKRVVELISKIIPITTIDDHESWVDGSYQTLQAMKEGQLIIYQGYLVNPANRTKGRPDLLVRSDILNKLKSGILDENSQSISSSLGPWHYRVVDIKMSNIDLTVDGKYILNSKLYKTYKAQVLVYNLALEYLQGYQPPQAYLLGRGSHNYDHSLVNGDCFSSIATIDYQDYDSDFLIKLDKALEWHETLNQMNLPPKINSNQYDWSVLNNQVQGLGMTMRPNMKNSYDYKWNDYKKQIAEQTQDITLLWNCGPARRQKALDLGITKWPNYLQYCQDNEGKQNNTLSEIISTNMGQKLIHPDVLDSEFHSFLPKVGHPFLVLDFEVSSNLNDDFSNLPYLNGQEIIFLIGASLVIPSYHQPQYRYFPFLIDQMTLNSELDLLKKFMTWIADIQSSLGPITFYHWSKAEPVFFEKMVERQWDSLSEGEQNLLASIQFSDLLTVFRHQPITIKGAFEFGLKGIAKSMYQHGMIQTIWKDQDINGLAAMLRIFKYNQEAIRLGVNLEYFPEVQKIVEYNMVDCQVLAEIIYFLQQKYLTQTVKKDTLDI